MGEINEIDPNKAARLNARIAKLLDKARQERRHISKKYVRGLLDSINSLGCNDSAISKLLRISRASVSRWRWRAYPNRINLAKLEFLKEELERLGPSTRRWPRAPESGRTPGGKPIRFEAQDKDKRMAQDAMKLRELKWSSGLTWLKIAGLLGIGIREVYNLRACRKEMRTETKAVLDVLLAKYSKGRMWITKKEEL
jgi:hypothetical protein